MGTSPSGANFDLVVAFAVLQFVALVVLSVISHFLKRSLGDLDDLEEKVAEIQRDAALRTDLELVDKKIDTLRSSIDGRLEDLKDTVNNRFDRLKETINGRIGELNTQVAVIIDRDRMRRVDDYEIKGLSRRQKPREREGEV